MENELKQRNQRNRRRERAQRMQAQRESKVKDGDSGEDESPAREKPPRPPARRKKSKEPLGEEDIIDGFAIMAFRTYEDLEAAVKCASAPRGNSLTSKPRLPLVALAGDAVRNHPPNNVNSHGITLLQDAGTSDDSGRASERLTGSSVAPRDPDSSRDRLSDCDSEGDDDKASPDNSRNASPRFHDVPMEDVSESNNLFRVKNAGGGGGGGKNELVARGGSGGALALSRAPVGGSASPAPAPLPQPAPSPAPAALPPPALPPPPFRGEAAHRPNGAHIPTLDHHAAATQIPVRPVSAATPERPASNNKLPPGARAAADSPTPAPTAPPAPSPRCPSHSAYQAHPGTPTTAALPDYRHTNHETRTSPAPPPPAPMELQQGAARAPAPPPPAAAAYPTRVPPAPPPAAPHSTPTSMPSLPTPTLPARPASPPATISRPYPPVPIGSSHISSTIASGIHGPPPVPYQSQPSLQKHSVQPTFANHRPSHLAPFSVANHISSNHIQPNVSSQPTVPHLSHPVNSHSILNHTSHLSHSNSNTLATSTPNHISSSLATTPTNLVSSYTSSLKHPGLSLPPHSVAMIPPTPASIHSLVNHMVDTPASSASNNSIATTMTTTTSSHNHSSGHSHSVSHLTHNATEVRQPSDHPMRQPTDLPMRQPTDLPMRQPTDMPMRQPSDLPVRQPSDLPVRQPSDLALRQPLEMPVRQTSELPMRQPSELPVRQPLDLPARQSLELPARTSTPPTSSLSSNGFPAPALYSSANNYPPLYAPYAPTLHHSPYLPPAAASPRNTTDARTSLSSSPLVAPKTPKGVRPHTPGSGTAGPTHSTLYSPRGPSPSRERESFSNISSLSRSTSTASSAPTSAPSLAPTLPAPLGAPLAAPLPAPLAAPLPTPLAAPLPTPLPTPLGSSLGSLGGPLGSGLSTLGSAAPVPTVPSISSAKPPAHWAQARPVGAERPGFAPAPPLFAPPLVPPNPNPFSAESLLHPSNTDLLRRELDNRFLAAGGAGVAARAELHHHQHQHTHVHQHPPHHPLLPPQYKDVGKIPSLYRTGLGLGYPYSSSLLHPAAPYVPPAPISAYAPKPGGMLAPPPDVKPPPRHAPPKTGKWNAMHVRIAWEIYNHQQKEKAGGAGGVGGGAGVVGGGAPDKDKLRVFPAPPAPPHHQHPPYRSPYDLPPAPYMHHPHLGVSPFARYGPTAYPGASAFGLSAYGRELLTTPMHGMHHSALGLHDAWRARAPPPPAPHPPHPPHPAVSAAAAAAADQARRDHEERERARREREDREKRDREDRERRKAREREMERVRVRSPLRNGVPEQPKEERKEGLRMSGPMSAYPPPPSHWDLYRPTFDPLQHMRLGPLMEAALRAEEDHRAKMFSAYAHHQQLKASPLLRGGLGPLAPPLAPLPPLAPQLAPLAPLDLLKKEEPR